MHYHKEHLKKEQDQERKNNKLQKLSKYRDDYYAFTQKLSDINRQIAFAGIAIIWVFKQTNGNEIIIEQPLIYPLKLIVIALALDMLHYIYQSSIWAIFYSYYKHKYQSEDHELDSSPKLNIIAWALFAFKVLLVIIAYYYIFEFFNDKLVK